MIRIKTLKKNYEFKNVLSKGKFYIGKQISIYILKNNLKTNVIGIAVSTKQCNAVLRNRIKRLIRENYRLLKNELEHYIECALEKIESPILPLSDVVEIIKVANAIEDSINKKEKIIL